MRQTSLALAAFALTIAFAPDRLAHSQANASQQKTAQQLDARINESPAHLAKHVSVSGHTGTVDSIYLRIIVHDYEHLGQLIAYARMNGVVPPWSK